MSDDSNDSNCGCPPAETLCNLDRRNNVWVEGADANGVGGICMLDNMTEDQVVGVLKVDDRARADLLKVTSDTRLRELADTVTRLPEKEESDKLQSEINRNKDSIPFYSIFRGNPPFAQ